MPIVDVSGLVKRYPLPGHAHEQLTAVNGIGFAIDAGEIYGILGPNGAGKTTTLEMIEGLLDIDEGRVIVDGIDVRADPYAVKRIIGVQLQANEYFDHLSLVELLDLFAGLYGRRRFHPGELLELVDLGDKARATPANLSGGQQQRFSIACALVNEPRILFLDEPTTGLDPQAKRNLWKLATRLNAQGMTIVLTTHNMEEAETLCHRVAIMDQGAIIAEDAPLALITRYAPVPVSPPQHGSLEDVFLTLTGHGLRD